MSDFNEIYTKKWKQVYKNCYNLLFNHSLAEEATQDTMYKLMVNFDAIDQSTLDAWLKTVSRNICINILKKQTNEKKVISELSTAPDTLGAETMKEAKEIVSTLAPKYREIFHLAFVCGMRNKEISEHLQIPLTTVKSRLKVCLDKISGKFL